MTMQEIWMIKEELSEKFWGKTADEINDIVKPDVDEIMRKMTLLREQNLNKAV